MTIGAVKSGWRRRLGKLAVAMTIVIVIAGAGGELVARYWLGLGDPPLYQLDPDVEYRLVPGRTYHRMGHVFSVNSHSMRSPEFTTGKAPGELRVLVVGDSIVNGGARIDQAELATELLRESLAKKLGRPVVVANASAASWGPPNELAFIRTFGLFDADIVILVLNSDDLTDVPGIEGIGSQWPRTTPVLALQEIWDRTILKGVERVTGHSFEPAPKRARNPEKDEAECLEAARTFFETARAGHARVALVQYLTKAELQGSPQKGYAAFKGAAGGAAVPTFDVGEVFYKSLMTGRDPFLSGDGVHSNALGQRLLAGVFEIAVTDLLAATPANAPPENPRGSR